MFPQDASIDFDGILKNHISLILNFSLRHILFYL